MKWNKYTVNTTTEAVDFISELFSEIGIEGIEIEDNIPLTEKETKGMFIDILPELPPDDGSARVSFYLDDTYDIPVTLRKVQEGLTEIGTYVNVGPCTIESSETEDKDWINNWKQYFKPFTVDDILIKPTWESIPEAHKDKLLIQIDPGTAFGTGMHETSRSSAVRGIQKYVKTGDNILDVGTGSGILAICALKLGAATAVGTDLDENAIHAAKENMESNQINQELFHVITGNLINDQEIKDMVGYEKYDVAVANILADVIIPLQKVIAPHIKTGGIFITSGIIDMKEAAVKEAFLANNAFEIIEINHQGEWVSVIARKK
ncbi:MAG: 50S ribosomal protein L11 methyltransferase [Lachnospiraceae bacterium]